MLETFDETRLAGAGPRTLSDVLERGGIVYLPKCPVPLPAAADLDVLRNELPAHMKRKNVSYHPEADAVSGLDKAAPVYATTHRVLTRLRDDIAASRAELQLIQRQEYILLQARAYGLGKGREIPFSLAPDAPPLPPDAPGSAAVRVGAGDEPTTPFERWMDLLFGPG